jgi:acyl-CoA thioesterase
MMSFQEATAISLDGGKSKAVLNPGWDYWGPLGGFIAAIALRSVKHVVPSGHRPVTMSCQFLSRADFGPLEAVADIAKSGASACVNVSLVQNGRRFFQAQVWTTARDRGPVSLGACAPDVPGPAELMPLEEHIRLTGDIWAPVWANFDVRVPFYLDPTETNPRGARAEQWLRFRNFEAGNDAFLDAARFMLMIDMLPWVAHESALSAEPDYAAPSLDLTAWFHAPALDNDWLLIEARADIAQSGLIYGSARIWTEDKRLVATGGSHQLVVHAG